MCKGASFGREWDELSSWWQLVGHGAMSSNAWAAWGKGVGVDGSKVGGTLSESEKESLELDVGWDTAWVPT